MTAPSISERYDQNVCPPRGTWRRRLIAGLVVAGLVVADLVIAGLGIWIVIYAGQSSAQAADGISVRDVWARSSEGTTATAVYLTIVNRGEEDDVLMEASSPLADRITIERLRIVEMRANRETVPLIKVPALSVVELKPSDRYLAVKGLKEPLRPGQSIPLALRFQKGGRIEVTVEATNQELGNRGR